MKRLLCVSLVLIYLKETRKPYSIVVSRKFLTFKNVRHNSNDFSKTQNFHVFITFMQSIQEYLLYGSNSFIFDTDNLLLMSQSDKANRHVSCEMSRVIRLTIIYGVLRCSRVGVTLTDIYMR